MQLVGGRSCSGAVVFTNAQTSWGSSDNPN